MRNKLWTLTALATFMGSPVLAAEDYVYVPKDCEFRMNFPEAPSVAEACKSDNPTECYKAARFNRVYALDSAVKITTTCNGAEDNMLQRYSGEVMQFTLESMSKGHVDKPETSFIDQGDYKQVILIGGKKNEDGTESVYMSQLWIGKKSVFTVEGEVSGAANTEADELFTNIMQSIRHESRDKSAETAAQPVEKPDKKDEEPDAPQKTE